MTIHRRLHRRLQALQLDAVAPYVERLRQDPQELAGDVLIQLV
jgi:chemotaxis methyl-accepting protein methylase